MGVSVMTRPQWQAAKDLWISGFSAADLSARFGVKPCTIYSYAYRHGWPPSPNARTGKHGPRSKGAQETLEYPGVPDSTAVQTEQALDANPVALQAGAIRVSRSQTGKAGGSSSPGLPIICTVRAAAGPRSCSRLDR